MEDLHYIVNKAQAQIEEVRFNREITNEKLGTLALLILEFFLSFLPFYNSGVPSRRYLIFSLVFIYVFSGVAAYDITFKHLSTYRTMLNGVKLMNVVYPTPKSIVYLGYTYYTRQITLLTAFCLINCFLFRFFLHVNLAIFVPQVLIVGLGALLGWTADCCFEAVFSG